MLDVTRSPFDHGTVTMDWDIQGLNGKDPAAGFQNYQGFLEFQPVRLKLIIFPS